MHNEAKRPPPTQQTAHAGPVARRLSGLARGLAAYSGVDLVEQAVLVVEVEVLREVARRLVARGAVEGHVERDQARALGAADRAAAAGGRLGWCLLGHGRRLLFGGLR